MWSEHTEMICKEMFQNYRIPQHFYVDYKVFSQLAKFD